MELRLLCKVPHFLAHAICILRSCPTAQAASAVAFHVYNVLTLMLDLLVLLETRLRLECVQAWGQLAGELSP